MSQDGRGVAASDAGDRAGDVAVFLQSAVTALTSAQAETARSQADAARVQADASIRLAELQHASARITGWQDYSLRVAGIVVFMAVVAAGFYTQRFELVSHALSGAVGLIAGLGLARKRP